MNKKAKNLTTSENPANRKKWNLPAQINLLKNHPKAKCPQSLLIPASPRLPLGAERAACPHCGAQGKAQTSIYSLFIEQNLSQFPIFNFNLAHKNNLFRKLSEKVETAVKALAARSVSRPATTHLKNLENAVMKFMLSQQISEPELARLSPDERRIFSLFLNKKHWNQKGARAQRRNNGILQTCNSKRVEENLKLVFNNAIGFLKSVFRSTFEDSLAGHLTREYQRVPDQFEYCFFGFYFEEAALRLDQEIERFFVPKILSKRRQPGIPEKKKLIPKTISKVYLSRIRQSRSFLAHFKLFLEQGFLSERTQKIRSKTSSLLLHWDTLVQDFGKATAFKHMEDGIKGSERNKLAWTVKDIEIAIEQTLGYVDED